ncbi:MAG: UDP-N-acetyl-D-glucosamine 6-dehydrogenase [Phycisphaerae bacterium]|nr:UDP-N-acetyl-D-glucosamine 6-dehydrogenase [Phycisphaerae bacterium]
MDAKALVNKFENKKALVGIIGLGYVGLPLVREFAAGGLAVLGFDIDARKVEKLAARKSYIKHIPDSLIEKLIDSGKFHATSDMARLNEPDAILICVPTPLTPSREPDLAYVESTARSIAKALRPGQLVVLESTTYPGTTREVVLPILEAGGLKLGRDFLLAFSPEREDPGRKDHSTRTIPKVVGGLDEASLAAAVACYSQAVARVVPVNSADVAEACKILENVFRSVNIALVNELKVLFDKMGIDVWEVIRAASTKPFGFMPFYPGPGLGGHCIPIDPFYLTWKARQYEQATRFIELAGEINTAMPDYVVRRVQDALNDRGRPMKGSRVLVLGLAYKRDVDDDRESPSFHLIAKLQAKGCVVNYNDPYIPHSRPGREHNLNQSSVELTDANLASYDCVLIATDHSDYDYARIVKSSRLVVDTRNATAAVTDGRDRIVKA